MPPNTQPPPSPLRLFPPHEREQLSRFAALTHNVEAGPFQEACETLAEENFIVRQYHPRLASCHAANYL